MDQLPQAWQDILLSQPETGMGYQRIEVTTSDGKTFSTIAIACGLKLIPPISAKAKDITSIKVLLREH